METEDENWLHQFMTDLRILVAFEKNGFSVLHRSSS
jgi:hypothetical protein